MVLLLYSRLFVRREPENRAGYSARLLAIPGLTVLFVVLEPTRTSKGRCSLVALLLPCM